MHWWISFFPRDSGSSRWTTSLPCCPAPSARCMHSRTARSSSHSSRSGSTSALRQSRSRLPSPEPAHLAGDSPAIWRRWRPRSLRRAGRSATTSPRFPGPRDLRAQHRGRCAAGPRADRRGAPRRSVPQRRQRLRRRGGHRLDAPDHLRRADGRHRVRRRRRVPGAGQAGPGGGTSLRFVSGRPVVGPRAVPDHYAGAMDQDLHDLGEALISTAARVVRWAPKGENICVCPRPGSWPACRIVDPPGSRTSRRPRRARSRRSPTTSSDWSPPGSSRGSPIRPMPASG